MMLRGMQTVNIDALVSVLFSKKGDHNSHLLAEANPWTSVEGHEYEGVRCQILVQSVIQETFRVEVERYGIDSVLIS